MKIELPTFDLRIDKLKQVISHYLELEQDHIVHRLECFIDKVPDIANGELNGQDDVYISYREFVLKKFIVGIDVEFVAGKDGDEKYDVWQLRIRTVGVDCIYYISFPTEKKAFKVQDTLEKYLTKQNYYDPED